MGARAMHAGQPLRAGALALPSRVLIVLVVCFAPVAHAAEPVTVEARRAGTAVAVSAHAIVKAPLAVIWATLTDYERLPQFIPGIEQSRVIGRRGEVVTVEQIGEASLWFIRYPIRVVVESSEYPPSVITIQVLRGNLKQLSGCYDIAPNGDGYIVRWNGIIEPDTQLPAFITVPLMRANIKQQFAGMVREIERREALRARREGRVGKS